MVKLLSRLQQQHDCEISSIPRRSHTTVRLWLTIRYTIKENNFLAVILNAAYGGSWGGGVSFCPSPVVATASFLLTMQGEDKAAGDYTSVSVVQSTGTVAIYRRFVRTCYPHLLIAYSLFINTFFSP